MLASYVIILFSTYIWGPGAFITEFLTNDTPDELIITSLGSNKSNKHIPESTCGCIIVAHNGCHVLLWALLCEPWNFDSLGGITLVGPLPRRNSRLRFDFLTIVFCNGNS